jgi:hypothetical protein
LVGRDEHSLGHETEKAEQLLLLNLNSENGKAGFFCYNVTPLPESLCSTLFATVYKRAAERRVGAFAFSLWLELWGFFGDLDLAFALGFGVRSFLKRKRITEGKRIAKGKFLKGKEWIKRG